jgi:chromosome segregation protein
VTGGLADQLQVPAADTAALEILLAETLDAVVVDGWSTAVDLVRELREEEIGQASFLCGGGFTGGDPDSLPDLPGGRPAREVITGPGAEIPALKNLLARTVIYDTDKEAAEAAKGYQGPGVVVCVSRTGLLVSNDGVVRGGRDQSADSGLIGRKGKLAEMSREIQRLEKQVQTAQDKVATNRRQREDLREELISGRGRLSELDDEMGRVQVDIVQLEHRRDTAGVRAGEMEAERSRLETEMAGFAEEERNMNGLLAESGKQREDSTTHRNDLHGRVEEAELTRDEARAMVEELRLTHQRRESQKRETETALVHLRENVAEQFSRRERMAQEIEVGRGSMEALAEELDGKKALLGKSMDERARRRQVVRAAAEGIQALHEETSVWHERVQFIEKQRGGFRDQAHEMETLLATLDIKRNNLEERVEEQYQQRDDVEKARDDLVKAITEINRTAKKRFVQTFEEVRRNYIAVFQTLFKGGKADLQMIRTDDPLESNIHIKAQPTGKIIDTVSLLSGGERCLTALSLLFAVYLVKPSPFCILDEADAPLDDVNIGRFVNMLRKFSRNTQFLVITHNKLTMETANHLYGVTMMEPGCSSIVSVSFHDVAETQSDQELGKAIADRRQTVDKTETNRALAFADETEAEAGTLEASE